MFNFHFIILSFHFSSINQLSNNPSLKLIDDIKPINWGDDAPSSKIAPLLSKYRLAEEIGEASCPQSSNTFSFIPVTSFQSIEGNGDDPFAFVPQQQRRQVHIPKK